MNGNGHVNQQCKGTCYPYDDYTISTGNPMLVQSARGRNGELSYQSGAVSGLLMQKPALRRREIQIA